MLRERKSRRMEMNDGRNGAQFVPDARSREWRKSFQISFVCDVLEFPCQVRANTAKHKITIIVVRRRKNKVQ